MLCFDTIAGAPAPRISPVQWSQLHLERRLAWIHSDQAKARKTIAVRLNAEAVVLIRKILRHAAVTSGTEECSSIQLMAEARRT